MWSATALMCYLCYCDASVMLSYCATVISCFQIITAMVMLWLQFCYLVSLCKEGKNWPFSSLGLGSPREWGVDPLWQGKNSWRAQQSCLATRVLGAGGGRLVIGRTPSPSQSTTHPPSSYSPLSGFLPPLIYYWSFSTSLRPWPLYVDFSTQEMCK